MIEFIARGTRQRLVVILSIAILATPCTAWGQQAGKIARVATLWTTNPTTARPFADAIEEGLRELGWIAGRNLVLEHHFSEGRAERLTALAAEVIATEPNVIVAPLNPAALALTRLTGTVPIVIVVSSDPAGVGLATSLGRPGRNVTGMTAAGAETNAKRLQMLRELAPAARRVGVIWNAAYPGLQEARNAVDDAAHGFGMTIIDGGVRTPEDFRNVFGTMARQRVDALIVFGDNLTFLHRREIVEAAARNRWPAIYTAREFCDDGGLACYGVNLRAHFKRSATFVDKILRGASPATIPIEQPITYNLVINHRTAAALGVAIPPPLRLQAEQ